jgi:hypothetical protein
MMEVTEEKSATSMSVENVYDNVMGDSRMRHIVLSLVAATALLASVGAAAAKDPVKLTDVQLDKVTAGDAASNAWADLKSFGSNAGHAISDTFNRLTKGH